VYWSGYRKELLTRLGHRSGPGDLQEILCGPAFESLPVDQAEKASVLWEAEETFSQYYRMVEKILTNKELEERLRQAAERRRWTNAMRANQPDREVTRFR